MRERIADVGAVLNATVAAAVGPVDRQHDASVIASDSMRQPEREVALVLDRNRSTIRTTQIMPSTIISGMAG